VTYFHAVSHYTDSLDIANSKDAGTCDASKNNQSSEAVLSESSPATAPGTATAAPVPAAPPSLDANASETEEDTGDAVESSSESVRTAKFNYLHKSDSLIFLLLTNLFTCYIFLTIWCQFFSTSCS
jgi:hypothetical protein